MTIPVLFVCLGNICRSPMAEAVFRKMVADAGLSNQFHIDSVGTSNWHAGESACKGTRRVLAQHGINYQGRARAVQQSDVRNPDTYVIAMDEDNERDLRRRFGDLPRLYRLLDFAQRAEVRNVPDPYYEGNFEYVYELVVDGCQGLLATIRSREGQNG